MPEYGSTTTVDKETAHQHFGKLIDNGPYSVLKLKKKCQDLKALLKHKEKWEQKLKKERQQRENDMLDEIGQVIFNSRES